MYVYCTGAYARSLLILILPECSKVSSSKVDSEHIAEIFAPPLSLRRIYKERANTGDREIVKPGENDGHEKLMQGTSRSETKSSFHQPE